MATILLVEDDEILVALLEQELAKDGHEIVVACSGGEGRVRSAAGSMDLIVLDLGLPDMSGHDLARHFRANGNNTPILMLTARDTSASIIEGLDAGADDYLTKPFEMSVLKARIRALLRRRSNLPATELNFGDISIDLLRMSVTAAGKKVKLTPKEYDLLNYFLARPTQIVSRADLLSDVWGINFDPGSNVADVTITRLRGKLKASTVEIASVRGRGYMLTVTDIG